MSRVENGRTSTGIFTNTFGQKMVTWMLETKCVGDKLEMLVTDLKHCENHQHNEKSRQHNDSATNISNLSPS